MNITCRCTPRIPLRSLSGVPVTPPVCATHPPRSSHAAGRLLPFRKLAFLLPLCLVPVGASAVTLPSAGTLGGQLRQEAESAVPAPLVPSLVLPAEGGRTSDIPRGGATVVISKVVFTGLEGTGVSPAEATAAVADLLGRPQDFAGLQNMTGRVSGLLQKRGMLLAQAVLPAQNVTQGTLSIQVVPGRYDRASVANSSPVRQAVVLRMVDAATPEGSVVRKDKLERLALLLAELPGTDAGISLQEGQAPGTSQLAVAVNPGKRTGGYLGLDNQGDRVTGRQRVMGGAYVNEILGMGDQLRVDLLDAYQKSNLFNGALDYSLQVTGYGTRAGMNYSHLNYRYALQGVGFSGYSDNWGLYVTHPWIRTAQARVDVRADVGQQFLTDNYPAIFSSLSGGSTQGRKQVDSSSLSLRGSLAAIPGGLSSFSVQGTTGNVDYRSPLSQSLARSDSAGQFSRLNYQLSHEQQAWGALSFYGALSGQVASHNLDSSQKIILGGPFGVRAYDTGSGQSDQGTLFSSEIRVRKPVALSPWLGAAPAFTVAGFYDQAWGQQYKDNVSSGGGALVNKDNHFSLSGAGMYASLADAGNYALTLTWARRTGMADPVSGRDERDRVWLSAVKTF
ncbi:ShlB/FhaC/HecB family hemolysin secretion/activation protein [Salmonella enterica subsp. diarizonae]|nr:ShlB/FhaC/HecB family hemolysin secretion/activation protein [Salmonella enterica subsp. diarizonae]ECQ1027442.1 ShlB/FhaC/HecB family hemolysin secretion/activation protein [Salmonella enterica subsp. diarizonae]EDE1925906.1 ShlB/FhaC/HecB family hemolysin secretion/activation protein [Salmonella enterica subsp. diarizonae]